ncbi:MAG: phosphotransferase [Coriobacteriales bacterium]|nr:phosphotransferase [Coriobacteriales bacterium]
MGFGYRQISTEGLKPLGRGKSGTVYWVDDDKVVKIYHDGRSELEVLREYLTARLMEEANVRAMRIFEVVKSGDAFGLVCERLEGVSFRQLLFSETARIDKIAALYAHFMREGHLAVLGQDEGVSVRPTFERWTNSIRVFSREDRDALQRSLSHIPNRLCLLHMDPTPENLLLLADGSLAWIDLESCGTGHPAFSLQALYFPDDVDTIPGVSLDEARVLRRFWHSFARNYFVGFDQSRMGSIIRGIKVLAVLRSLGFLQDKVGDTPLFRAQASALTKGLFCDIAQGLDYDW